MSKKRKNKSKNLRTITKSQKALYNVVFGGIIALLTAIAIWISDICKLLHKPMGYSYVQPTVAAYTAFFVLFSISFILAVYFYGSLIDKKKTVKQIKQKAKIILPVFIVLAIAVSVFCFPSYYRIDENASFSKNTLFGTEEVFAKDEINKVGIRVEKLSHSIGGRGPVFTDYSIVCSLSTESGEYQLNSDCFYSYRAMYDYLSRLNAAVEADRGMLEELCEHQKNIPLNFSAEKVNENIEYINKIFDLENA